MVLDTSTSRSRQIPAILSHLKQLINSMSLSFTIHKMGIKILNQVGGHFQCDVNKGPGVRLS